MKTTFLKSKSELAKRLRVTRVTLDRWLTLPGFPEKQAEGWPLEPAMAFTERLRQQKAEEDELALEKLRLEVAQGEIELLKASEEAIPVAWCLQLFAHLRSKICGVVESLDIAENDKVSLTEKIKGINADEFLAQMRAQTLGATVEDGGATE